MEKELKVKIGIVLDKSVLLMIDDYAVKNGISRSASISILCVESLEQKTFMQQFPAMMELVQAQAQAQATE